jgi:hypothetical protein
MVHEVCSELFDSLISSDSFLKIKVTSSAKMVHILGDNFHFGSHFGIRESGRPVTKIGELLASILKSCVGFVIYWVMIEYSVVGSRRYARRSRGSVTDWCKRFCGAYPAFRLMGTGGKASGA